MGKCPNCGNDGFFLMENRCAICGKTGCEKCLIYVLTLECRHRDYTESERVWVCSEECYQKFKQDYGTEEKDVLLDLKKILEMMKGIS